MSVLVKDVESALSYIESKTVLKMPFIKDKTIDNAHACKPCGTDKNCNTDTVDFFQEAIEIIKQRVRDYGKNQHKNKISQQLLQTFGMKFGCIKFFCHVKEQTSQGMSKEKTVLIFWDAMHFQFNEDPHFGNDLEINHATFCNLSCDSSGNGSNDIGCFKQVSQVAKRQVGKTFNAGLSEFGISAIMKNVERKNGMSSQRNKHRKKGSAIGSCGTVDGRPLCFLDGKLDQFIHEKPHSNLKIKVLTAICLKCQK